MVALDEDEFGACSNLSSNGNLGLNIENMYELVDPKVSKTLFEVVPD